MACPLPHHQSLYGTLARYVRSSRKIWYGLRFSVSAHPFELGAQHAVLHADLWSS
ncbi:Uncharacterised protein [Vibrio cholerae]|nr:Uncharacterised protein [Vibrio cholerae]CSC50729.1 Uncharacterised protein [Vibrio cholerae]CSI34738.1 Uncharacterised protein [Vibrio cholerae]